MAPKNDPAPGNPASVWPGVDARPGQGVAGLRVAQLLVRVSHLWLPGTGRRLRASFVLLVARLRGVSF
ncbi:MAG: hypothetical protein F7C07_08275 [Desulfurococcales archaeon]|nr:hypothetical protein [Desulfurococcales archaeon]